MECRPFEITLKSATDLKYVNLMSKMDVYATVSISGDVFYNQKQKTPVLKDCGSNPRWNNYSLKFTVPETGLQDNRLMLKIKLVSNRALGDKEIGEIEFPVKELLDNYGNGEEKREKESNYSVRLPKGKGTKGTLTFGYKFGDKYTAPAPTAHKMANEPVIAYPPGYASGSNYGYPPPPQGAYSYPPPQPGYGYPPPPPAGYGYPPAQAGYGYAQPQKPKRNGLGGAGLGLGAGLLGGLLIGDMISDVGEMGGYDGGFDDGGFDF